MSDHTPTAPGSTSKMAAAVGLTLLFVGAEAVAGIFAHSLSLLSDAGHDLGDAVALGFSWYALWIARKPANRGMTYGYHRVGVFAALFNALSLVIIALLIVWQALGRLENPGPVEGWVMIGLAGASVGLNVLIGHWLHADAGHNLNIRSAYIHMMGDAASAMGVVVAGIIVVATGWRVADPIASFLIAALILWTSWGILKESVNVLLEGTPQGMDMAALEDALRSVPGVRGVHDLHVWTVGPGAIACSCHIVVAEQTIRAGEQILREVVQALERHAINHTTVQVEVEGHGADEMYCCMEPRRETAHGAGH